MLETSAPVTVPRVRTPRLLLREWKPADFEAYAADLGDPIARELMTSAYDRRTAWRYFAAGAGMWMLTGAGWWAVELVATGECVGTVGVFHRENQYAAPLEGAYMEIGWTIYRSFWRRGFAKEAAKAALDFGFGQWRPPRIIAHVDAKNLPSIGVTRAIGMRFDGECDFYGEATNRYVALAKPSGAAGVPSA